MIHDIVLIILCVTVASMLAFPSFVAKVVGKLKKIIVKYFKKV